MSRLKYIRLWVMLVLSHFLIRLGFLWIPNWKDYGDFEHDVLII